MIIDTHKIEELPLNEQLKLMEVVMGALIKNQDNFQPPEWHLKELEARANEANEPENWRSYQEVRNSLKS